MSTFGVLKVSIEYGDNKKYKKKYLNLKHKFRHLSFIEFSGIQGRKGSFEIMIDNKVLYSKLYNGIIPDKETVLSVVKNYLRESVKIS